MFWYAEIDENGICFHISDTELPLSDTIIKIDNPNVLGWTYSNGEWIEPEPVEPPPAKEPQPTNADIVENQYSIMMAITDLYEMNMPTE